VFKVARAKRRRKKGKAFRYFMLAALTLVIAGFIARHEIWHYEHPTPAPAKAESRAPQRDTAGAPGVVPPIGPAGATGTKVKPAAASGSKRIAANAANNPRGRSHRGPAGEELSGSDRRELSDLIKERSH
jgi:hypothetical protein